MSKTPGAASDSGANIPPWLLSHDEAQVRGDRARPPSKLRPSGHRRSSVKAPQTNKSTDKVTVRGGFFFFLASFLLHRFIGLDSRQPS